MTGNNPFEDNPWSGTNNNGPRFGNAYEDDNSNAWSTPSQQHRSTPDPVPRMPSPSDYRANSTVQQTSWNESNKTEYPTTSSAWDQDPPTSIPSTPQNAYQYSGTRYASPTLNNTYESDNAYSKTEVTSQATPPPPAGGKPRPNKNDAETALPPVWDEKRLNPSKLRLLLRFLQLIASIGHLGFAAGASPVSYIYPIACSLTHCFYCSTQETMYHLTIQRVFIFYGQWYALKFYLLVCLPRYAFTHVTNCLL